LPSQHTARAGGSCADGRVARARASAAANHRPPANAMHGDCAGAAAMRVSLCAARALAVARATAAARQRRVARGA
jgi:hypothetical protein